jgi:beta-glucosidase
MKLFQNISSSERIWFTLIFLVFFSTLFITCSKVEDYPRKPDRPGSGNVKWTEILTPDGWTMVTNEDGATLGYSKSSGLQIIQVDGYAFKDLNRNNLLDEYEDWRVDFETRAASIVGEIPVEQMMGMKMNPFGIGTVNADALDDVIKNRLETGYRQLRAPGSNTTGRVKASWNNMVQEYIETLENIVCIPAVWIADPRSGDISEWPSNLAMAATFDPEVGAEYGRVMSEEWRALGISMQVATQMDLATEPRWKRISGTFGEDPALSMDMARAIINGWQSTYDAEGNDLGWGEHSVNNQMKHWPGDGAAEGGRESHTRDGAYNVFPGGQFFTHLLPFIACLELPGKTGTVSAAMTNFSIAIEADGSPVGKERVASSYSPYKINTLLRENYGWDGYILTDFGIITGKNFGVEKLTPAECMLAILEAGSDAFGGEGRSGQEDIDLAMEAYNLGVKKHGEDKMNELMRHSTLRILRTHFNIGIVDNPYLSIEKAETVPNNAEHNARGYQAMLRSVVMLKNSGGMIGKASAGAGKPTVYIPRVYSPATTGRQSSPATAKPAFDLELAGEYFNVVTDALSNKLTGPADEHGNPAISPKDIIRASAAAIAKCDFALVRITSPQNGNPTYMGFGGITTDGSKYTYLPISLQYRPYTANSEFVRKESLGGDMMEVTETSPEGYGDIKSLVKENRSYFGKTAIIKNESDLDLLLKTASAAGKTIVAINASSPMVFKEFENEVDVILVGFGGDRSSFLPDKAFLEIIAGQVEPSGLLPLQMPANMETVEAQFEDVPRDMECHVDSDGNTYDFAFGLNWSGVINDARTAKYGVTPITGGPPKK